MYVVGDLECRLGETETLAAQHKADVEAATRELVILKVFLSLGDIKSNNGPAL